MSPKKSSSDNLLSHAEIWDDRELVKMYDRSKRRVTEAIAKQANLKFDDSKMKIAELSPQLTFSPEDAEEGEIDEFVAEDGEIEGEDGEIEDSPPVKRSRRDAQPVAAENNSPKPFIPEDQVVESAPIIEQHPSVVTTSLISPEEAHQDQHLKSTLNATLASYWQAGFHAQQLEQALGLQQSVIKVPQPIELRDDQKSISNKFNSALMSYWQAGYYNASSTSQLMKK